MTSIRLPENVIARIKQYAQDKSITQQEAYREIINKGLNLTESDNAYNEKLNEIMARNSIESKYFMQQIYRHLFDVNKSKHNTPDDEFADIKAQAIEIIKQYKIKNDIGNQIGNETDAVKNGDQNA